MSALSDEIFSAVELAIAPLCGDLAALLARLDRMFGTNTAYGDEMLTAEQVAQIRGCHIKTIRRQIARGKLPCKRQGRAIRIRRGDALKL